MASLHNALIANVRVVFLAGRVTVTGLQGVIGEVSTKFHTQRVDKVVSVRLYSANGANRQQQSLVHGA